MIRRRGFSFRRSVFTLRAMIGIELATGDDLSSPGSERVEAIRFGLWSFLGAAPGSGPGSVRFSGETNRRS